MAEPFLGQIILFGGEYSRRRGWAFCDGSLLSISQYTALFSLLGTTYGGNGRTNFALPDLRGRAAVGFGQAARSFELHSRRADRLGNRSPNSGPDASTYAHARAPPTPTEILFRRPAPFLLGAKSTPE